MGGGRFIFVRPVHVFSIFILLKKRVFPYTRDRCEVFVGRFLARSDTSKRGRHCVHIVHRPPQPSDRILGVIKQAIYSELQLTPMLKGFGRHAF